MPLGDPPEMRKGGWPVIGERPYKAGVFDTFPESLYKSIVCAVLDLHDGFVKALKVHLQRLRLTLFYIEQMGCP